MVSPTATYYASILNVLHRYQLQKREPTHQADVQAVTPPPTLQRHITIQRRIGGQRRVTADASSAAQERSLASGLCAGAAFGAVSTVAGYPLDMIKSKMRATTANSTFRATCREVYRLEGVKGYYRGMLPPLMSTTLSRSPLFVVSSHAKEYCFQQESLAREIPNTGGLRPAVLISAVVFGSTRTVVETAFELVKVQAFARTTVLSSYVARQDPPSNTRRTAADQMRAIKRSFVPSLFRSVVGMGTFYVTADYISRDLPDVVNIPWVGPFVKGAVSGVVATTVSYPLDSVATMVKAGTTTPDQSRRFATFHTIRSLYQDRGVRSGLYRGYCAGAARALVANGFAMLAYTTVDDLQRHWE